MFMGGLETETLTHILETITCMTIHTVQDTRIRLDNIFTDNIPQLRTTAKRLEKIENLLDI